MALRAHLNTRATLAFLFALTTLARAYLDVFIKKEEIMKLLGLDQEMYYVRAGVVNHYALNFFVLVPANISDLEFSWRSLGDDPLPYTIAIEYELQGAILPPEVNISAKGFVPTHVETFRVTLPCTGTENAEIGVQIKLHVRAGNSNLNDTNLNFRRKKICLKGIAAPSLIDDSVQLDPAKVISYNSNYYIAVSCAAALISVLIIITSSIYVRSKKVRSQTSLHTSYGSNQNVFIRLDSLGRTSSIGSGSYATIASIHKVPLYSERSVSVRRSPSPYATTHIAFATKDITRSDTKHNDTVSYYASSQLVQMPQVRLYDPRLCEPSDKLRSLYEKSKNISCTQLLQEGTFGKIYRGQLRVREDHTEDVVVKTVTDVASNYQISLFLAEGTMMYGLNHKNVLTIIAANVENPKQPLLVYPHVNKGNLKRFLISCRIRGEEQYTLLTQDLVDMAIQCVLGVMYLHSNRICHKDIATRNCVVDEKLRVKVTDNALSRDIWPGDYHCLGDNENRPVKWMALESLIDKQFGVASDVWSFGVLLWELTTLAQQPYAEVDPFEMTAYLSDGYRLAQPVNCPDELFAVMACCWLNIPEERPTFVQLLAFLQDFYTALGRFI